MIIGSKYGMSTADNICILQILVTVGIRRGHNKCEPSANFLAGCHLSKFKISRKSAQVVLRKHQKRTQTRGCHMLYACKTIKNQKYQQKRLTEGK